MSALIKHRSLIIIFIVSLLAVGCTIDMGGSNVSERDLEETLSAQSTLLANLSTQAAGLEKSIQSQGDAISYLATQMPIALGRITPIPPGVTLVPTPYAVCTPPACAPDEMYYCPGECPGGCGTTCATATPGASSGSGVVWGEVCYPSEGVPAMTLYFQNIQTSETLSFPIQENQTSYRYELPAGVYIAFAWLPDREAGGSYSEYVLCGAGANCTDHTLVPFLVQEDHVTTGVDICDWYGDAQLLPPVPGG